MFEEVEVLGYQVAKVDLEQAASWVIEEAADAGDPRLLVTLNPEIVVQADADPAAREALRSADLVVADGIGLVWAASRFGHRLPGRVSGVDLVARTLERGGPDLRVYFLGGRPGVAERAADAAARRWGTDVAGHHHGYFAREGDEAATVARRIRETAPHLLLAGLGEGQELFLHRCRHLLGARVLIGVGGTLDVLAGEARRTPAWTRRAGLEWAWRVGLDRRRWHRLPRLVRFVRLVLARS